MDSVRLNMEGRERERERREETRRESEGEKRDVENLYSGRCV